VCDLTNNIFNSASVNLISYSIFDGEIDDFDGVKGVVFSAIPFFYLVFSHPTISNDMVGLRIITVSS